MFREVDYDFNNIKIMIHEDCIKELDKFLKNPVYAKKITKNLLHNLNQINIAGPIAIQASQNMEYLKNGDGLCSMKINLGIALRLLFQYQPNEGGKDIVLTLYAFQEERGKRQKNSYDKGIEICRDRRKEWKEYNNGSSKI